jgi:glutamyl-tRNA reductase
VRMTITGVGLNHQAVPVELLERLILSTDEISDVLRGLLGFPGVREAFMLSTCNRVEAYIEASATPDELRSRVAALLAPRANLAPGELAELLAVSSESAAVEHLFRVVCGLDSMAVGEDQIVAQVRGALRHASASGTLGPMLSRLGDAALTTSKRARTETEIGRHGISLAHAGVALCREHLGSLTGRTALVIGAGTVGSLAARLLAEHGAGRILVASRTEASARRVADSVEGTIVSLEGLPDTIAECDVVVTAVGSPKPVLTASMLEPLPRAPGSPLFLLDLAMPRDIDPTCRLLPETVLADIEIIGRHLAERRPADDVAAATAVVAKETAAFLRRRREQVASPLISAMRSRVKVLVDAEVARLDGKLTSLDGRQRAVVADAVRQAMNRLIHGPTVRARELSAQPGGAVYLEALSQLFEPIGDGTSRS